MKEVQLTFNPSHSLYERKKNAGLGKISSREKPIFPGVIRKGHLSFIKISEYKI